MMAVSCARCGMPVLIQPDALIDPSRFMCFLCRIELDGIAAQPTAPHEAVTAWTPARLRAAFNARTYASGHAPDERADCLIEQAPGVYCVCAFLSYVENGPTFPILPAGLPTVCPTHWLRLYEQEARECAEHGIALDAPALRMLTNTRANWFIEAARAQALRIADRLNGWAGW